MSQRSSRMGMTLVELLVVIAIIGVLVALLLPAVQAAREAARRTQCANNLKQLGLAVLNYESTHKTLPTSTAYDDPVDDPVLPTADPAAQTGKGWILNSLPFLEQQSLFESFASNGGFSGRMGSGNGNGMGGAAGGIQRPACLPFMKVKLSAVRCPSDTSDRTSSQQYQWSNIEVTLTSYKGVIGDTRMGSGSSIHTGSMPDCHRTRNCNGLFWRHSYLTPVRLANITDGTSNTLAIGEDVPKYNWHSGAFYANGDYCSCHGPLNFMPKPPDPSNWPNAMTFRSLHPGGAQFCLADGSVRLVSQNIDHNTYRAVCTREVGESATLP
jgi:prepilin-type N-terminal cleavage/methylation domain-containing protein/prepilin-type processing-associated H-X9-DG protein